MFFIALAGASLPAHANPDQHSLDLPDADDETPLDDPDSGESADGIQSWDQFFTRITHWRKVSWGIDFGGVRPVAKNNMTLMMPASTQKVITAIAALKLLGGDFRFKNSFQGHLDPKTGILTRPEFLLSGDPTWGDEYYDGTLTKRVDDLARELKRQGVSQIHGPMRFSSPDAPALSEWKRPEGNGAWRTTWRSECYAVVPTSVILNGNCATFKITGYRKAVWLTPGVTAPLIVNLSSKGKPYQVTPILDSEERITGYRLTGKLPTSRTQQYPLHTGQTWLEDLASAAFKRAGIGYTRLSAPSAQLFPSVQLTSWFGVPGTADPDQISVDLSSQPLRELLVPFVQHSINIVGDRLYLELAYRQKSPDAESIIKDVIASIAGGGADLEGIKITDGSGLRLDNQMRPSVLRSLLAGVQAEPYFNDFFKTLAVAGESGTLRSRMSGGYTRGKVFGKTGTVNGVKNLVGYFQKPDDSLEPFVFLTQTRSISESAISPMIDKVLVEFARQNLGLAPFQNSSPRVAKKTSGRRTSRN